MHITPQILEQHCNVLLNSAAIRDYCPNGLQVEGERREIRRIVSGVTANLALIHAAARLDADLLLVHHGWFWRNEPLPLTGLKGQRVRALLAGGRSLLAYHLPLDIHPELGNNRQLGERLALLNPQPLEEGGLLWGTTLSEALTAAELAQRIHTALGRVPLHLPGGAETIRRLAWCSGAAQGEIVNAAERGYDAFISGEVSESTTHLAAELGIHYFAAGHHASERYGVIALGDYLAEHFTLEHHFIDIDNPV